MIGRRTLVELLHIAAGVVGAAVIANGAVWALPHAEGPIWEVACGMIVVVVLMGIKPLRLAVRSDRSHGVAANREKV